MSQEDTPVYKKCVNCGKFSPEAIMIVKLFCSEECADQYKRCPHCGNYFLLENETEQTFCSTECQNADKIYIPGDNK